MARVYNKMRGGNLTERARQEAMQMGARFPTVQQIFLVEYVLYCAHEQQLHRLHSSKLTVKFSVH